MIALIATVTLLFVASVILIRIANPLPSLDGRSEHTALGDTGDTPLAFMVSAAAADRSTNSGVFPLADPHDAFCARVQLARSAVRSLDLQYYIWKLDATGQLMFEEMLAAADRGVRVRLLLDDNVTSGLDHALAQLNAHPNVKVRLFNPFVLRRPRFVGYLTDFWRLNRRMHNKSFTVDNQVTIVGGRNIGDEYMGASEGLLFADLDVLAIGPIVKDVSRKFDIFWASPSAYPFERIVKSSGRSKPTKAAHARQRELVSSNLQHAVLSCDIVARLGENKLPLIWAPVDLVADDPAKGLGQVPENKLLFARMRLIVGRPSSQLKLVSPYFVPQKQGVVAFKTMVDMGVEVTVLTNALEATDVPIVHSGYAHRRKALLKAGVRLFEMHALEGPKFARRADEKPTFWPTKSKHAERAGTAVGGSMTALHAKTFAIDRQRVFVGSFNFDPRSERLNTEMGLIIDSAEFAKLIDDGFKSRVKANAYEVKLSSVGKLYWISEKGGERVRYKVEPGTTLPQRLVVRVLSYLPIEWLL